MSEPRGSPASAGMVPSNTQNLNYQYGFPRQRGDGPERRCLLEAAPGVPPPARGWSRHRWRYRLQRLGSPASAGMVPRPASRQSSGSRFPRQRGDGPLGLRIVLGHPGVPPPARGWSHHQAAQIHLPPGSPASAGMVLPVQVFREFFPRFPRQRGDGPIAGSRIDAWFRVPPPARGWSVAHDVEAGLGQGSPASAGMVPRARALGRRPLRFPRQRGDGPVCHYTVHTLPEVPPPARGWSQRTLTRAVTREGSPASAGMVPQSDARRLAGRRFPRQRGDGPKGYQPLARASTVPPPARGWSPIAGFAPCRTGGSPASAGMVPTSNLRNAATARFPRQRGDGPEMGLIRDVVEPVPPPARGWS